MLQIRAQCSIPGGGGSNNKYTSQIFFDRVLEKHLEKERPIREKSRIYAVKDIHEFAVFHYQESLQYKFDLFWKVIGF